MLMVMTILLSCFSSAVTFADNALEWEYEKDGDRYTFLVRDESGNSVFTADLDPAQMGEETYYIFNPMDFGINLDISLSYGMEEVGNGGKCPTATLSVPLPGCCGVVCYALMSAGSREAYSTALLCDTATGTPALVYADGSSKQQGNQLLLVNGVSSDLYDQTMAEITQITGFVIAPAYFDEIPAQIDCQIEEFRLDSLTLYFRTGEQACECLAALISKLGIPGTETEDYYFTENGTDYWYIPIGKDRSEAIRVAPMDVGYYAIQADPSTSAFFQGDYETELVAGNSSVFYISFAEPVSQCMGIVSNVKLTMIGLEAMSKYLWGVGVKETPSQKWFFLDYFDYVSAVRSGEWVPTGITFPEPMMIEGFIVCPMEYFDETFTMQYDPGVTLLFGDGAAAMRFMRQLDSYSQRNEEDTSLTRDDLLNLSLFHAAYDQMLPKLVESLTSKEEWPAAKKYMTISNQPEIDETDSSVSYYNSFGDMGIIGWYQNVEKIDVTKPAIAESVYAPKDFFPLVSSFLDSFILTCDSSVDAEGLEQWITGLDKEQSRFQFGDFALIYSYNPTLDVFTYMLANDSAEETEAAVTSTQSENLSQTASPASTTVAKESPTSTTIVPVVLPDNSEEIEQYPQATDLGDNAAKVSLDDADFEGKQITRLVGRYGDVEGVRGPVNPFYLDYPVIDCDRIKLILSITPISGYGYGHFYVYVLDTSGHWHHVSLFKIEKSQADGKPVTYEFELEKPETFVAVAICGADNGMDFVTRFDYEFYVDSSAVGEYSSDIPRPSFTPARIADGEIPVTATHVAVSAPSTADGLPGIEGLWDIIVDYAGSYNTPNYNTGNYSSHKY